MTSMMVISKFKKVIQILNLSIFRLMSLTDLSNTPLLFIDQRLSIKRFMNANAMP